MEIQIPLVLFTLFLCLSCGMMGFQGLLLVQGKGDRRFHLITVIATVVSLVIGGIAVFTHLHHWERIFNGFGHITSGITHELILVVVMVIALVALFVVLQKGKAAEASEGEAPAAEGKMPGVAWGVIFIVIALIGGFVTAHSYDMYARPAWNNVFLYLYYYSSELILGSAGVWALAAILKQDAGISVELGKLTLITGVISAVVCVASMAFIANIDPTTIDGITFYTYDPTHPAADPAADLAAAWSGSSAGLFWAGAVVVGGVIPAIAGALAFVKAKLAENPAAPVVALVAALAGGVCYRICLYVVGIASYVYFF